MFLHAIAKDPQLGGPDFKDQMRVLARRYKKDKADAQHERSQVMARLRTRLAAINLQIVSDRLDYYGRVSTFF